MRMVNLIVKYLSDSHSTGVTNLGRRPVKPSSTTTKHQHFPFFQALGTTPCLNLVGTIKSTTISHYTDPLEVEFSHAPNQRGPEAPHAASAFKPP